MFFFNLINNIVKHNLTYSVNTNYRIHGSTDTTRKESNTVRLERSTSSPKLTLFSSSSCQEYSMYLMAKIEKESLERGIALQLNMEQE